LLVLKKNKIIKLEKTISRLRTSKKKLTEDLSKANKLVTDLISSEQPILRGIVQTASDRMNFAPRRYDDAYKEATSLLYLHSTRRGYSLFRQMVDNNAPCIGTLNTFMKDAIFPLEEGYVH